MSLVGGIKKKKKECTVKNILEGLCIIWYWYFALKKETEVERSYLASSKNDFSKNNSGKIITKSLWKI